MTQPLTPPKWSLEDLLPEPVERSLELALDELTKKVTAFEEERGRLSDSISQDDFLQLLNRFEDISRQAGEIFAYASLSFYADTKNQASLNLRDRVYQALTYIENRTLFFTLWLKGLPEETARRITPQEGDYRYYIQALLKFKPYTLSENEEQIINLKDVDGIHAMTSLYDMITSSFAFTMTVDSEERTLTRDELGALYRHPSPDVRAAAYQELFRVYKENSSILAQIYNHRVRDWHSTGITIRKYPTPISVRNLVNDIPDEAVEALLDVCTDNNKLFQRYFRLKAKWLGVDKLRRYDIYAPLTSADKSYEFGHAVDLIMDSFRRFSPAVADMAQRVFDDNHIDAEIRPGKRGGAFCYSVSPSLTPWVHVNYTGKARDVATMAHELGHAIHGMAAGNRSYLTFHAPLPLAETASVFAEMLLTDRLLAEETDPAVRRDLLAYAVDDAYSTVQRQAYITLFEREAHKRIMDGGTYDQLCAANLDNVRSQFGDVVEVSDDFQFEWMVIPHIYHTPFYTYAYSFGQLLVLSLYQQYRTQGGSFIPQYMKLLSYGGSEEPAKVLHEAGFDIASPAFWQGGYDVLRGMIDELENL